MLNNRYLLSIGYQYYQCGILGIKNNKGLGPIKNPASNNNYLTIKGLISMLTENVLAGQYFC